MVKKDFSVIECSSSEDFEQIENEVVKKRKKPVVKKKLEKPITEIMEDEIMTKNGKIMSKKKYDQQMSNLKKITRRRTMKNYIGELEKDGYVVKPVPKKETPPLVEKIETPKIEPVNNSNTMTTSQFEELKNMLIENKKPKTNNRPKKYNKKPKKENFKEPVNEITKDIVRKPYNILDQLFSVR